MPQNPIPHLVISIPNRKARRPPLLNFLHAILQGLDRRPQHPPRHLMIIFVPRMQLQGRLPARRRSAGPSPCRMRRRAASGSRLGTREGKRAGLHEPVAVVLDLGQHGIVRAAEKVVHQGVVADVDLDRDEDGRLAEWGAPEHLRGGGSMGRRRYARGGAGVEKCARDGFGGVLAVARAGGGGTGVDQGEGGGRGGEGGENVGGKGEDCGEKSGQHGGMYV